MLLHCQRDPLIDSLIARFMGPTWAPSGADRTQVAPCWAMYWAGPVFSKITLHWIYWFAMRLLVNHNNQRTVCIFQRIYLGSHAYISTKTTRQIWGIWKLRPAYSPETPNLGQNRWCFVPCDLEIWWMTLENNRAPPLCCFKLCAIFHSHRWIQTGVAVRKRPIWVKFDDF